MGTAIGLSEHARSTVERERDVVVRRLDDLQAQALRLRSVAEAVEAEAAETARLLRNIDEMLGLAPQLSMDALNGELRGKKLQEVAVELLRQRRGIGAVVHYREWFGLLAEAGLTVAGRDPLATFLTQIGRATAVESVRPRSGLYRLRAV